jgi:DNA-binding transcriptional MerR regulator
MSLYPIRTLAEQTGVPTMTLRAWERRYGLLKPTRTPKGHRLYSQQDIDLVKEVVQLLQQGYNISDAARHLRGGGQPARMASAKPVGSDWVLMQQNMLQFITGFNDEALDNLYNQALSLYPVDLVTEQVILPVLKTLGERWDTRETGIAEEHFFSAYLRNKLGARLHHEARRARGARLLAACLPDEHHELGLLLFCLAAMSRGYRLIYLGADLPLNQLAHAAHTMLAHGVLLSGTRLKAGATLQQHLSDAAKNLHVPVMIGGEFSARHQTLIETAGAIALGSEQTLALQRLEHHVPVYSK